MLTALVFVLALAQERLRRAVDAMAQEAQDIERTIVATHLDHRDVVTTMDLWERAVLIGSDLRLLEARWTPQENRKTLQIARQPLSSWGGPIPGAIDRLWTVAAIDRELQREPEHAKHPSPRRKRYLERERKRIVREHDETRVAAERAGLTVHGLRRVIARGHVGQLAARSLVTTTRIFIILMMGLVVVGAIYAGWSLDRPPTPEIWAAIVLLALAWTYAHLVEHDIDLEVGGLAASLRDSPLFNLDVAEGLLTYNWDTDDVARRREIRGTLEQSLEAAVQRTPALPWLASLRGRVHLLQALSAMDTLVTLARVRNVVGDGSPWLDEGKRRDLLEDLRPATRLLNYAAAGRDDPVAVLAQARLLELHADLLDQGLLGQVPDFFTNADADELRGQARNLAALAVTLVSDIPMFGSDIFSRPHRRWIEKQTYLWPKDPQQEHELRRTLQQMDTDDSAVPSAEDT